MVFPPPSIRPFTLPPEPPEPPEPGEDAGTGSEREGPAGPDDGAARKESSNLARKALSGAFWSVATGVLSRVMSLASTLIVTRYVDPKSYGEVSVAYVVTQLASLAASLGVGQYVSTRPGATKKELFHAAVVFHGAGIAALALVYLFRAPLGPIFGASGIEGYIVGYVVATLFERISLIPESMLIRDMRFRANGLIGTAGELLYSVLVLVLAARGMGGIAIIYAGIARCVLRAGLGLAVIDPRAWLTPHRIDRGLIRDILRYGLPITGARLSSIIARRGDNLAFSTLFGPARMGAYNLAYNLADVPATTVGERIGDVLVPSFAKLPAAERPAALVRSLTLVGFAVFPLAAGLSGVSRPLSLLLNDTWQALDVRWMLVFLALLSVARPIEWSVRVYLQVAARNRIILAIEWVKVLVLMAALFTFGMLGPVAACAAVSGTFLASAVVYLAAVGRAADIPFRRLLGALSRPGLCAGLMWTGLFFIDRYGIVKLVAATRPGASGVHLVDRYLLPHWGAAGGITLGVITGAALYAAAGYFFAREELLQIVALLRRSRRRGA